MKVLCGMGVKAHALKQFHLAWTNKVQAMNRMSQATRVKPFSPEQVFTSAEHTCEETVKVNCGPAVFHLCERAGGMPNIYVVVEGTICLKESDSADTTLRTTDFATRVGYFRPIHNRLEHVYGVHYEMDERGDGHPVFHSQMGPLQDFAGAIRKHFRLELEDDDYVGKMLRNVRIPTAQMDFFSVLTQLCADHLMGLNLSNRDPQITQAFGRVRSACSFMLGAGHRFDHLSIGNAMECYRSWRWYGE